MAPLISVIVPTYNRTRLLTQRALPSVFAQTVQDQEILVVGDGTSPATVRAIAEEHRVTFWNRKHPVYPDDEEDRWKVIGLEALNDAIDRAKGEWIAVLADDDEWLPNHHEVLLDIAERSGADHVYGKSETWKAGKRTPQTYGEWPPLGPGHFCNGANLYRRELCSRFHYRYDLDCLARGKPGDEDLWERMVLGGVTFAFTPITVHRYHRHYP